ncbi:MAG TPA: gluconokinase [Saprospiraceae bacterium]|nr:gluconokinase [Saprospiraceae bacterium]HMQ84026.1 gluconokinase [Saprospiraceae bacterium]
MNKAIFAIDLGTTATKVLAFDEQLNVLAKFSQSYPILSTSDGFQEQEPAVLFHAVCEGLKFIARQTGIVPDRLCFSSAMHSLILVGKNHEPLTNAILWSDIRSAEIAERLRASDWGKEIYAVSGTPVHPMSPLCKLRWFREKYPALLSSASKLVSIKDYILFLLTGAWCTDWSMASATGLWDILTNDWHPEALVWAGISREQLPALGKVTDLAGYLTNEAAEKTQLPSGTPIVLGGSDGCLANLGALVLDAQTACVSIGTSGAYRCTVAAPAIDVEAQLFNYRIDEKRLVCGGATNNGGNVYQWLREQWGWSSLDDKSIGSIAPGAEGLFFLPYLLGERAPIWDARASGAIIGLKWKHTPVQVARAAMEGVAYSLYQISRKLPMPVSALSVGGGFTQSPTWLQILSDVFNLPLLIQDSAEISARGAALIALKQAGVIADYDLFLATEASEPLRVYPIAENHEVYRRNFPVFEGMYMKIG